MTYYQRSELAKKAVFQAERLRTRLGVARTSPIDIINLANNCGCDVWFKSLSSLEGVYSNQPRPSIILGSQRPAGRRNYNCAHELGHYVFNHGMSVEELNYQYFNKWKHPNEYIADLFAGYILMSQASVRRTLKERNWYPDKLTPHQLFVLSCYFGVGYSSLINHLTWTLKVLPQNHYKDLLKIKPKEIKMNYHTEPKNEVIIVDQHWLHKAVDLEIGDTLIVPNGTKFKDYSFFKIIEEKLNYVIASVIKTGLTHAAIEENKWAVNIRIARKNYNGLAIYRFLEDFEEEDEE